MRTRDFVMAIGLAGLTLVGASVNEAAAPIVVEVTPQVTPLAPSPVPLARSLATLPTPTPLRETLARSDESQRVDFTTATLPALTPQLSLASLPTVIPSRELEPTRAACDPAYPDERTCIPPGPPFEQGCAITDERRFTVLAPDPQGLNHDGAGSAANRFGAAELVGDAPGAGSA